MRIELGMGLRLGVGVGVGVELSGEQLRLLLCRELGARLGARRRRLVPTRRASRAPKGGPG